MTNKPKSGPFLRWEKGEVELLKEMAAQGRSLGYMVDEVNRRFRNGRTKSGTYRALQRYGKTWNYERTQYGKKWAPEELAILSAYYRKYGVRGVMAVLEHEGYKRSQMAIHSKVSKDRLIPEVADLVQFQSRSRKRGFTKLVIARRALQNALEAKEIVDLREEMAAYTNIELSTFAIAAKQLVKDGVAISLDKDLIAVPIKEVSNDSRA